ncbi:MAG: hypothetical protein HFH74_07275 [Lachnospiraceae bacterium]|nr:hypothetical protein [Lachnospiraceae bacterium]
MTDNALLLAISNIMQSQVEPIKHDIRDVRLLIENEVMPRLNTIESCYTTYHRYVTGANQIEILQADVDIIKKVAAEHSEKLQKIL